MSRLDLRQWSVKEDTTYFPATWDLPEVVGWMLPTTANVCPYCNAEGVGEKHFEEVGHLVKEDV